MGHFIYAHDQMEKRLKNTSFALTDNKAKAKAEAEAIKAEAIQREKAQSPWLILRS